MRKTTILALAFLFAAAAFTGVVADEPPRGPEEDLWGMGGGGPPGRGGHRGFMRSPMFGTPVTEAEEQEALAFAETMHPGGVDWLDRLKTRSPDRYNMVIRSILFKRAQLNELRSVDSLAYNREVRSMQLWGEIRSHVRRYRRATDEDARTAIRTALVPLVDELFELRESDKRNEIERLARELERLRSVVAQRRANKADIVRRKVDELLGEVEEMEW